jgi:hypothetical protein
MVLGPAAQWQSASPVRRATMRGRWRVSSESPRLGGFSHQPPIGDSLPPPWMPAVREFVDLGARLLGVHSVPAGRAITRQLVLETLTRRALITAEGVCVLVGRGLAEPALATLRTLIELQLRAAVVAEDPGDDGAQLLVAAGYIEERRAAQHTLNDPGMDWWFTRHPSLRSDVEYDVARLTAAIAHPRFNAIRGQLDQRRPPEWHGEDALYAACAKLGLSMSYREVYAPASAYVHGGRPDDDLEVLPDGALALRGLVTGDVARLNRILTAVVIRLRAILLMYVIGRRIGDEPTDAVGETTDDRVARKAIRVENAFHRAAETLAESTG